MEFTIVKNRFYMWVLKISDIPNIYKIFNIDIKIYFFSDTK